MSTTPRGRSSSRRRNRCCKCAGGGGGKPSTPCCFNPLRSLFRCPGRGRGRSRSRSHSRNRTAPSRVSADIGTEQQGQEPSFFVYSMGSAAENKKKKHRKARLPSIRSCFRSKKKERKASARCQPLTPAPSMVTHPPRSPPAPDNTPAVASGVTMTQPPSPAFAETGNVNSPATSDGRTAPTGPGKQPSADSAWAPFPPQRQQPKQQVDGLQIVEAATGERLSAHEAALIEMVESSTDDSAESSMKSSLEFINEPSPQTPVKRMVADRETAVVKTTAREAPRLWLNGNAAKAGTGARFSEPLVVAEANELWAHDIACSRAHAAMLADTVYKC
uniref:Uncharacterized protein n=1 Tax=Hordeum vulgare subsp. vulgare TaxID=112509 RepID=A0A8I6XKC7_HORVV